jgi:hypothetical protein
MSYYDVYQSELGYKAKEPMRRQAWSPSVGFVGANKNTDMKVRANQEASLDLISWLWGEPIRIQI